MTLIELNNDTCLHTKLCLQISGDCISGDCISGNFISGNYILGNCISGNCISGNCISGDYISGNYISGNCISGNYTVKTLITNTSEEFIKCRLDNFLMSFILYYVNFTICENK